LIQKCAPKLREDNIDTKHPTIESFHNLKTVVTPAASYVCHDGSSSNGRYLQELRTCLTLELDGRPCNAEVLRDACKSDQIIMRPVR